MNDPRLGWGPLERTQLGDFHVFRVSKKEGKSPRTGKNVEFHVIEAVDWVQVVAVTTDGKLILVDQFRPGAEVRSVEFSAGMVDPGEDAGAAAGRELLEETGFVGDRLIQLGAFWANPAIQNNKLHIWLALGCTREARPELDDGEVVRTLVVDEQEVDALIANGRINHAYVLTAWHLYLSWRSQRSASRT